MRLPTRVNPLAVLAQLARDVREAGHRSQSYVVDDDGVCHVRGGAYGNGSREAYGYTLAEAKKARALLRKRGVRVTIGEAEGWLAQALVALDDGVRYANGMTGAERVRANRQKRLDEGRCSRCGQQARPGKANCHACNEAAKAAVRAARARATTAA